MKKKKSNSLDVSLPRTVTLHKKFAYLKWIAIVSLILCPVAGCGSSNRAANTKPAVFEGFDNRPQVRMGCLASPTIGTRFVEYTNLGKHGYTKSSSESNGIVYTCRAGHIDIAHLRNNADRTAYLAALTHKYLINEKTAFMFTAEASSRYFVEIRYPSHWNKLPQKEKNRIADEVAIGLGQYFAYTASVWHEVLTWFGYKSTGFYPEFPSAFSWEDIYSDLLGTHIGAHALRDTEHTYDEAVTLLIEQVLERLGAQPRKTAKEASEKLKGQWFSGGPLFVDMKKRNFDVGLVDGYVTPLTLPYGCQSSESEVNLLAVPKADFLADYGLSIKLEIEPREWEKSTIFKIVYPNDSPGRKRIEPTIHFASIMEYIRQSAAKKYGQDANLSNLQ
ncbi:DUF4056 domain-containing protein [Planctomycetota bacterium]